MNLSRLAFILLVWWTAPAIATLLGAVLQRHGASPLAVTLAMIDVEVSGWLLVLETRSPGTWV